MTERTFFTVDVVRARPYADVLSALEAAGYPIDRSFVPTSFLKTKERNERPSRVELTMLAFPSILNSVFSASAIAQEASCRLADLWETAELAVTHPELFRGHEHLPIMVLGEPVTFRHGGVVHVPIFPDYPSPIPPLFFGGRGNFVGGVHFPAAKL